MSNNCVVAKYKGACTNINPPVFDKVFSGSKGYTNKAENMNICVYGDEALNVKFKVPVKLSGTSTIVTEYTVSANTPHVFNPDPKFTGDLDDIVEIDNMYHLKGFGIYYKDGICASGVATATLKSAYRSFLKYNNPIAACVNIADTDCIGSSVGYLAVRGDGGRYNISEICPKTVEMFTLSSNTSYGNSTVILDEDYSDSSITRMEAYISGDISKLPNNLEYLNGVSLPSNWTLEGLIQKFRAAGRTTGTLTLRGCQYCAMTYGGTPIKNLYGTTFPTHTTWGWGFISWDASTINVAAEDSEIRMMYMSDWISNQ